jgi:SWI/SNF-related matrix-associated actin-dependent regulator of chromatin subfamily A3
MLYRLNLTVATRVHIQEPQWNPSVEKQAIGRVLRLGQNNQITIIRYIMNGTVEEVTRREKFDNKLDN